MVGESYSLSLYGESLSGIGRRNNAQSEASKEPPDQKTLI